MKKQEETRANTGRVIYLRMAMLAHGTNASCLSRKYKVTTGFISFVVNGLRRSKRIERRLSRDLGIPLSFWTGGRSAVYKRGNGKVSP